MIRLEVDSQALVSDLDNVLSSIQEIQKPSVLNEIAKGVFSITSERFLLGVDSYARSNPKKMHHVYEWGQIGNPSGRLFVIERGAIVSGNLSINSRFLPSKLPVPINPELLTPGKTGKTVTRRSIFRDKATVMEQGLAVSFTAQRVLAFAGSNGLVFIAPGKTINILDPGGKQVKNAFAEYMLEWYTENGNSVMESSGFYDRVASEVAIVLNSNTPSTTAVKNAVANAVASSGLDKVVAI